MVTDVMAANRPAFTKTLTDWDSYLFVYLTGTVQMNKHFCKYARLIQKGSFHLQSLARCYNRLPKKQITGRVN